MFTSSRRNAGRSFRPRWEILEDRTLLSVCTVDRLTDNNPAGGGEGSNGMGDLHYCIAHTADDDTISFKVTGTINLTGSLPDLTHNISIDGHGADLVTVRRDTGGSYRIFTLTGMPVITISGLTISNGNRGDIGGGISNSGMLTVSNCTISGNSADTGGGIFNLGTLTMNNSTVSGNSANTQGGGIFNLGTLTMNNSTVSGNSAIAGGGIYNTSPLTMNDSTVSGNSSNSGIFNVGTLTMNNSTVSGNSVLGIFNEEILTVTNSTISGNFGRSGGGIYEYIVDFLGRLTINNSTISGNSALEGGGIYEYPSGRGTAVVRNTIIAGNMALNEPDLYGNLSSQGHNLIGNTDGGSGFDDTDLLNVDPMLGPLQDNGGPTQTMALQCGSPAIDAGDNTDALDWDQRGPGFPRIVNGIIDIGAYEVQKGECDGSAPHGPRDRLNRFVGTALFHHEMPQSGFPNIPLSVDLKMNTLPDYVPATSTEPDTFSISRPVEKPPVHNSVFLDLNWDLPELKGIIF